MQRENIKRKMQGLEPLAELEEEEETADTDEENEDSNEPDVLLKEAANILADLITIKTKPELIAGFEKNDKDI